MIELILVRHGETLWTRERRFQGHTNTHLTADGKKQVARLVKTIRQFEPDIVFASKLERARESAAILCAPLRKKFKTDARLNEINFGVWEGKTATELAASKDPAFRNWSKGAFVTPKGGETLVSLRKRIDKFVVDCRKKYQDKRVLVVTHGGVIRMFLRVLIGLPDGHLFKVRIDPASMTMLIDYDTLTQLVQLNATSIQKRLLWHERNKKNLNHRRRAQR